MSSVIGRGTTVRGKVRGEGDLEVWGFVEGEIEVSGDVTVEAGGMVGASIHARRVIVRGAVRGDLAGSESVELDTEARVVGDLTAPRVSIREGALVRGMVSTSGGASAPARGTRGAVNQVRQVRETPKPAAVVTSAATIAREVREAPKPVAKPAVAREVRETPKPVAVEGKAATKRAEAPTGVRTPPPQTVPVLKKGTKAQKRR
jgi:cytoskeletal protein CcmA (bactofilin family)